jgi:4-carboxymuconolactone decarboxylase
MGPVFVGESGQFSCQENRMKKFLVVSGLLVIGLSIAGGRVVRAISEQAAANASGAFPKDVYAETGNRLPALKREDLDEAGKKLYDSRGGRGDSFGPGGIRLYSPPVAETMRTVNDYLRHKSGLEPRLVELTILVMARELDCVYVWTDHEAAALKAGLPQATVDAVKYRKPLEGLDEKEATIIQLGREAVGKHQVSSATAARALNLFGKPGLVNLVSLMGDYSSTAVLLTAFDQHVRPTDKPLLPIP